jgi:hypothetical protein
MSTKFTFLNEGQVTQADASIGEAGVRLSADRLHAVFGWELKPQGLCKGSVCIPTHDRQGLTSVDGVDIATFADLLGRPLAIDEAERVVCVGESARDRGTQMASLEAPDFTLPDLSGRTHSLSDYRGRRVLLVAHASW